MHIASASNDVKIHTWPNGQLLHTYKPNLPGPVRSISWGKDGSWLVVVPNKGPAEVITIKESIKNLYSIQNIQQPTCAAFLNGTKRKIALGATTGSVLIYDIKSNSVFKHFPRAPSAVFKIECCAKDSFLIAACENGEILLYNSVTYNLSSSWKVPNSRTVSNVRCHPNKRHLVLGGSQEGMVALWDIHVSKFKYYNQAHVAPVSDLAFSPTRDDIIVTCGLDRKFALFDINANNCIVEKIMERSVTSIDFCADGIGLAVAMQHGLIHTYDKRQINEPLFSFTAHQTQIKQLLFQKKLDKYNESSEYNFSDDKIKNCGTVTPNMSANRTQSFESFDQFCGNTSPCITDVITDKIEDSFMDAMGLNSQHNTYNSSQNSGNSINFGISEGVKKLLDSKPNLLGNSHQEPSLLAKRVEERLSTDVYVRNPLDHLKSISTPKSDDGQIPSLFISPIINQNATDTLNTMSNVTLLQLENTIKDIKVEMQNIKQELKYELMDAMGLIRRHFLDFRMFMVKEFIQVEDNLNSLKEDTITREDLLIQENMQLRQELACLREQIAKSDH